MLKICNLSKSTQLFTLASLTVGLVWLTSCADAGKKVEKTNREKSAKTEKVEKKNSNLIEIEGKVFSIPSPIQTAFLLKEVGTDYQSTLLNPSDKASAYSTSYNKALALGVYGADLGYATIFDQTQDAITYMAVSKKLASDLGISGVFNEGMVKRFEENLGNQDSLLALVADGFKSSDRFLKENKQHDISVLVLAGGWIETLHFATSLASSTDNEALKNRIGEQKITIKNLVNILSPYTENQVIADLANQLNELKDIYAGVTFTYTYIEPTTDAESKTTTINSKSTVEMSDQQLKDIAAKLESIRNSITN